MREIDNVPVAFNMDLANAPTGKRFCRYVAEMFGEETDVDDPTFMEELVSEEIDMWNDRLSDAGYCAIWNAGDVVVYDLRQLSDDETEEFYRETEGW